jgi:hypothetical protein
MGGDLSCEIILIQAKINQMQIIPRLSGIDDVNKLLCASNSSKSRLPIPRGIGPLKSFPYIIRDSKDRIKVQRKVL